MWSSNLDKQMLDFVDGTIRKDDSDKNKEARDSCRV